MSDEGDLKVRIKNQRIIKVGNSHYIGIPARYIQDGAVDPNSEYDLDLRKSEVAADESA